MPLSRGIALLIAGTLLTVLQACQSNAGDIPHIGIILYGDSRQAQTDGFVRGMQEQGYHANRNILYTILNAKNDRSKLDGFVDRLLAEKVDLFVAAGGLEADSIKRRAANTQINTIVLYVNAIVERGLVKDRRNPGWNVTGIDNLNAELSGKRLELLQQLKPEAKKFLVLYYPDIAPSRQGMEHAKLAAAKLKVTIDARPVNSRKDISSSMASLRAGDVDAMITVPTAPIDNALESLIIPELYRLDIPLMTHSQQLAHLGALASYGASFYDLGIQGSRLAQKILKQHIRADKIPFETPKSFSYTVNNSAAQQLGIRLSPVVKAQINNYINSAVQLSHAMD